MYPIVKQIHVILVIISIGLFQYRYWRFKVLKQPQHHSLKILPHAIDTLLMISGISLAILASISPLVHSWLLIKLFALLFYIILGGLALKQQGYTQWLSYSFACVTIIYMLVVATSKSIGI